MREISHYVLEVAVEPKSRADADRLDAALEALQSNQSKFGVHADPESGQTILRGAREEELQAVLGRLIDHFHIDMNVGPPQVAYRETLSRPVTIDYVHKKQTGGQGQYARAKIEFEPLPPGSGFEFVDEVKGGAVPKEFIPAVEKGLKAEKEGGLLMGFPMIDFRATLVDGDSHEVDSSTMAFEIAARAAFRELGNRGVVKLLEPVMKVEVVTRDDFLGGVIGDLNSRRGHVQGTDTRGNAQIITAMVPLANMFGYAAALNMMCDGRASHTMSFDHYAPIAPELLGGDDPRFPGGVGARVVNVSSVNAIGRWPRK